MARIEKTVFISYRRTDVYTALAVYENLKKQGYDVFFDYTSIPSGDFEQIIISNIKARAHFLVILTPTALDRCSEPGDWLRREIEVAIDEKRNIVPLFFKGFGFGNSSISGKLTGKLRNLNRYNGLNVHEDYFREAMQRLRKQFLNIPLDTVLHPVSSEVQKMVKEEQIAADEALKQIEDLQEPAKPIEEKTSKPKVELTPKSVEEELPPVVASQEQKKGEKQLEQKPTLDNELQPKPVVKPAQVAKREVASYAPRKIILWRLAGMIAGGLALIALSIWGISNYIGDQVSATEAPMTEAPTEAANEAPATEAPAAGQVEVFSWWVGGGEAAGLTAMTEVFAEKYPDIEFVNAAVVGGSGTNARAVLATRLQAGDPPDSWQAHAGQEIIGTYVAADQVAPLDEFYEQSGFADVLPETLLPLISQDGHPYSVPVNIHRSNVMWYNPTVLSDAGVEVPTTWEEFFAACDAIMAADKLCLALGPQWTARHLFENVMIGSLGAEGWNALWTDGADWSSAEVTAALENFSRALSYTNSDAAQLADWQPAAQLVTNGDAAFNIMGDWADGYFENPDPDGLGLTPHEDFDWAPVPGTDGIFVFLSDSFVLPANAPNPDATNAWLTVAASKEGQEAFNPVKGSICARTDCDQALFNEYLQSASSDWSTDTVVGSLTHGVVANDAWNSEIDTALGPFLANPTDGASFQTALVDACASDGVCQ